MAKLTIAGLQAQHKIELREKEAEIDRLQLLVATRTDDANSARAALDERSRNADGALSLLTRETARLNRLRGFIEANVPPEKLAGLSDAMFDALGIETQLSVPSFAAFQREFPR